MTQPDLFGARVEVACIECWGRMVLAVDTSRPVIAPALDCGHDAGSLARIVEDHERRTP